MQPQLACWSNKLGDLLHRSMCEDRLKSVFKWEIVSKKNTFYVLVGMDGDGMDGEQKLLTLVLSKIVSSPNTFFMLIKGELR